MSYLWRAIRAQVLWTQLERYKLAKKDAVAGSSKRRLSSLRKVSGSLRKFYLVMQTEGTPENLAWVGCKGFSGGVVLSWVVFLFCIIAFRMSLGRTTWLSSLLVTFLAFGLGFSSIIRCYVLMLLPQLFSKRGRQALTAYAFILAFGGPARNSVHNLGVLTSSAACGQEQLKRTMKQLVDLVKEPLHAMKTTIKDLIKDIGKAVQPLRDVIVRVVGVFTSVLSVIDGVFSWLGNIVSVCNKETGTPYQRCIRSLDDAIEDCQVKLGPLKFMCSIVSVVKGLCLTVKVVDTLCGFMDMISNTLLAAAKRKLAAFRQHVADMLYVSIDIEHSVKMNTTASRSVDDVVSSIVREVHGRTETLRSLLNFGAIVPGFAFLLLIFKVFAYRHRFLTSDRYDNRYVTRKIAELDLTRLRMNLTAVLPLEFRERQFYTTVSNVIIFEMELFQLTSLTLLSSEQRRLIGAFFFLLITSVQIGSYIVCDYGIYWTLMLIRKQGLDSAVSAEFPATNVEIEGKGALADLYREIGKAFQPPSPKMNLDPVPCLPEPSPPNKARHIQIGTLLLVSWLLALTEPYGLRLRSVVMSHYYPARAQQRAVWLHNHILLARGSFAAFTRDLVRMQFSRSATMTTWQRIVHRYVILQKIFGAVVKGCTACAVLEDETNQLRSCSGPGCSALYCANCENRLRNCILCYEIMNRFSFDIDEARDSSEDGFNCMESGLVDETEDSGHWADESSSYSDRESESE